MKTTRRTSASHAYFFWVGAGFTVQLQVRQPAGCGVPAARQLALALHHRGRCDLHQEQQQGNSQGGIVGMEIRGPLGRLVKVWFSKEA